MLFRKPLLLKELTPRLMQVYLLVSLGAMSFGLDNNYWSAVVSMDKFSADLGTQVGDSTTKSIPSSWLSIASGTPIAGWVIGCVIASEITRRLGRRLTVVVICVVAIVGIVIQSAVNNYWAIMAGRLINSISMGIEANCIPMYMSELSPPAIRGAMVNFYQWWLMVGGLIAAGTVYGTSTIVSQWAWKTVIVVQIVIPVLLLCGIWVVPESPRWLLSQNRHAEALAALTYIRHGSGATRADVEVELSLLEAAQAEQAAAHRATSWLDCVRPGSSNARRTFIAVSVQCLQQSQGAAFLNTYLVIFLKRIGLPDPLRINVAYMCANLAGATLAFYFTDKLGRRRVLMGASAGMCVLLSVVSGLATWYPGGVSGGSMAQGCVAAIMLYSVLITGAWGSVTWTVTAEVATAQLRERTIAIATTSSFCCNLLITYVNPFVQDGTPGANLGARVGLIYASVSAAAVLFVWAVVPEMCGRSLEELDEMFQARVPAWRSAAFKGSGIGARLTVVQNANSEGMGSGKEGGEMVIVGADAEVYEKESTAVVAVEEEAKDGKEVV